MTARDDTALAELEDVIVTLLGRYIERRETGVPPGAHDLLAAAAEFGASAVDGLRSILVFYEEMRAAEGTPERWRRRPNTRRSHARTRPTRQPE
jgi:hypothetical protein